MVRLDVAARNSPAELPPMRMLHGCPEPPPNKQLQVTAAVGAMRRRSRPVGSGVGTAAGGWSLLRWFARGRS
jgi:hypothetical protein